jgi:hypothetical protein
MLVEFTELAVNELDDAIEFYNCQVSGLGKVFLEEVLQTVELISKFPKLWSTNSKNSRKALLKKFPYSLIYSIIDSKIYIIAVAHQNREPEYWIERYIPLN